MMVLPPFPLRILFVLTLILSALDVNAATSGDASPLGVWRYQDGRFQIYEDNGKLSGKVVSIDKPVAPNGEEAKDIHNPDPSKRDRPIQGLVFMQGFIPTGNGKWEHGTVYDPYTGSTYSATLELEGKDKLKVRGYVLVSLIGRTVEWVRDR
jgi:uncharacterized protein (DUF2147 family)